MDDKPRILIVDDDPTNIRLLTKTLQGPYDICAVTNGYDAISQVKKTLPDLLILDVMMPDLSGFEVCKLIKAEEAYADIPVLFLTANDTVEAEIIGLELGGIDYFKKPVNQDLLKLRVSIYIELKKQRDLLVRQKTELELANEQLKQTQRALQKSENLYRAVLENQTDVIARYVPGGTYTYVNEAYCRKFGKSADQLIGAKWAPDAYPEDIPFIEAELNKLTADNPVVVIENRVHTATGEVRWMQFVNRGFFNESSSLLEIQAAGRDITEKKDAELFLAQAKESLEREVLARTAALELANEEMKKVSFELIWAEEKERERIAGELHDKVGQSLLLAKMILGALADELQSDTQRTTAEKAVSLIGTSIQDIRSLTFKIRPPLLESSNMERTLKWLCASINDEYDIRVVFTGTNTEMPLTSELRNVIYHVVRELLLNVVKHAQTKDAELSLHTDDTTLTLRVTDNGVGFSPSDAINKHVTYGGYGLYNIHQRIKHIGGTFTVESAPGMGTVVTLVVPM